MKDFWKETFGYGIDLLTQGEAGHLRKSPSVDAIRTRIIEARYAVFSQAHGRASIAERSQRDPKQTERVTPEIPRPLLYHQALIKLESISAPVHEMIVAECKLEIASDLYAKGELDVLGSYSHRIPHQAREEARKILSGLENQSAPSTMRTNKNTENKTIKKSLGPTLKI